MCARQAQQAQLGTYWSNQLSPTSVILCCLKPSVLCVEGSEVLIHGCLPGVSGSGCGHILGSCMEFASAVQVTAIESLDPLCTVGFLAASHGHAVRLRRHHAMQVDKCDSVYRLCTESISAVGVLAACFQPSRLALF